MRLLLSIFSLRAIACENAVAYADCKLRNFPVTTISGNVVAVISFQMQVCKQPVITTWRATKTIHFRAVESCPFTYNIAPRFTGTFFKYPNTTPSDTFIQLTTVILSH